MTNVSKRGSKRIFTLLFNVVKSKEKDQSTLIALIEIVLSQKDNIENLEVLM